MSDSLFLLEIAQQANAAAHNGDERHKAVTLAAIADRIFDQLAATPQEAAPVGEWVMVPREPTPKMVDATWTHPIDVNGGHESQNTRNRRIYAAMLAAAPTPTDESGQGREAHEDLQCCGNERSGSCCGQYVPVWREESATTHPPEPPACGDEKPSSWRYRYFDKATGVGFWRFSLGEPQVSAHVGDLGFEKFPQYDRPATPPTVAEDAARKRSPRVINQCALCGGPCKGHQADSGP